MTALDCIKLVGITEEEHSKITEGILGDLLKKLEAEAERGDLEGARRARAVLWRRVLLLISKRCDVGVNPSCLASWAYSMDAIVGDLKKKELKP